MDAHILLGKLAIGVALTVLLVLIVWRREWLEMPARVFKRWTWVFFVASRLGMFAGLFLVFRLNAQSDVAGFYYPQMKAALHGGLVYRDFPSSYAPLFPYLGAGTLFCWDSPKALILLAICFEAGALAAWTAVATRWWETPLARLATLFYLLNPLPLINVAVDGQNQVWLACFLGLAVLWLPRRPVVSGWMLALGLALVKFLALIFLPVLGLCARHRGRWLSGVVLLPAVVYGFCVWKGADILAPLRYEGGEVTSGNLPYLLRPALPNALSPHWLDAGVLAALAISFLWGAFGQRTPPPDRPRLPVYLIGLVLLTVLIFSKKTFTNYLAIGFFPLCLAAVTNPAPVRDRSGRVRLALLLGTFGTLAMLEPSLWYRWLGGQELAVAMRHAPTDAGVPTRGRLYLFVLCDFTLLVFYAWHWLTALRCCQTDDGTVSPGIAGETACDPSRVSMPTGN